MPRGYPLRAIATTSAFLENNSEPVIGFLKGMIRAYRFTKTSRKHAEMMAIIEKSDLQFEEDMDQSQ